MAFHPYNRACRDRSLAEPRESWTSQFWLFVLAPLLGAIIASDLYSVLHAVDPMIRISASQAHAALFGQQEAKIEVAKTSADVGLPSPQGPSSDL